MNLKKLVTDNTMRICDDNQSNDCTNKRRSDAVDVSSRKSPRDGNLYKVQVLSRNETTIKTKDSF